MSRIPGPAPHDRLLLFCIALALGRGVEPTLAAAESTPADGSGSIRHHVLANGLEILLLPEPEREIASVQVWYRVAPSEEDSETPGFAHLLEHLMFTGTAANPDFRQAITALGGLASSGPREDLTYFADEVPRSAVARVIALEADRMRGLILSPAAIEASLAEVDREESAVIARGEQDEIASALREGTFSGHPYGAPARAPTASSATPERCRAFYERFYGPARACLAVAGGFEADSVLAAITARFGPLPSTGNARPSIPAPPDLEKRPTIVTGGAGGARPGGGVRLGGRFHWVALGYRAPGAGASDAEAMKLLESYLNVEAADSLGTALNPYGERRTTSLVTARLDAFAGAGLLTVSAPIPAGADAERILDRLAGMVARVTQSSLDAEGFAALRDGARLTQALSTATVRARATAAALAYLRGGHLRTSATADSALAAVEPADLARTAASYLRPDQAVRLYRKPSTAAGAGIIPEAQGESGKSLPEARPSK